MPEIANYGGIEQHICLLAARCASEGFKVTFLATSNSLNANSRKRLDLHGVRMMEMKSQRGSSSGARKALWLSMSAVQLRRRKCDIVYTNGQSVLALVAWRVARKGAARVHHHHTSADTNERTGWHARYFGVLARATSLIACSKGGRIEIARAVQRPDAMFLPYIVPELNSLEEIPGSSDRKMRLGFAGRLVSTKGIEYICALSTEESLSDVEWVVCGDGEFYPESLFASYPNIEYSGPYGDAEEYTQYLNSVDAVVLFSRHNEGMPLSLIEAVSANKAILATTRGGTPELLGNTSFGQMIPADFSYPKLLETVQQFVLKLRSSRTGKGCGSKHLRQWLQPGFVARCWMTHFTQLVA